METHDNVEYWSRWGVVTISRMINAIADFRASRQAVRSCENWETKIYYTNEETDGQGSVQQKNGKDESRRIKKIVVAYKREYC